MYESGQGVYPSTAGSFHNVSSVYSPMDNGRAAPQISAPAAYVPIYNPSTDYSQIHQQAQQAATAYTAQNTGLQRNFYDTRIMNASIYASAQSEMSARNTARYLGYASTAATVGSSVGGMLMGAGMFNPFMLGAMGVGYMLDAGKSYFTGYSDRMGDIKNIRQMYSHLRGGGLVDPATGTISNAGAMGIINALDMTAAGSQFTNKDIRDIHSMAGQMGLMQGHTGNASSVAARVKQLATLSKQIMDLGEGISPQEALEMQRMSEAMGVSLDKFKGLNMARQVITASKLAGQTLEATSANMAAMAQASSSAGLGGQVGAESFLFSSNMANTGFSALSAAQQAAVGGSVGAYTQRIAASQLNFASRNAQAIAMGSYYVDPATGQLQIDRGEIARMVDVGFDPTEANKRGARLFSEITDRRTRSMVRSIVGRDMGRLSREAIESMDPSTLLAMQAQELLRVSRQNNTLDIDAVARQLYGENAGAVMAQIRNYGAGRERRIEAGRVRRLSELDAAGAGGYTSVLEFQNDEAGRFERMGRARANSAAIEEDILRREAVGRFGVSRGSYTSADYADLISGNFQNVTLQRRSLRAGGLYDRTLRTEGRVTGTLAARTMRSLFANDAYGSGSYFEDEGVGAIGEFLYREGVFTTQSGEDIARELYGRDSRSRNAINLRLLDKLRGELATARDSRVGFYHRQRIGHLANRLRRAGMGDLDVVQQSLALSRAGDAETFRAGVSSAASAGRTDFIRQVESQLATRVQDYNTLYSADLDSLDLSSEQRGLVNLAERMAHRYIAEGPGANSFFRNDNNTRRLRNGSLMEANPTQFIDEQVVDAIQTQFHITREQAQQKYDQMGAETKQRLRQGVGAVARGRGAGQSNLNTFLARGTRVAADASSLITASGAVDYSAIQQGQAAAGSRTVLGAVENTHSYLTSPIKALTLDTLNFVQENITGYSNIVTENTSLTAGELVLGLGSAAAGEASEQEFKEGLQGLGALYAKLGDTLGTIVAGVKGFATSSAGHNYSNMDTLVRDYISSAPEGVQRKIRGLSSANENALINYLKRIATLAKDSESAMGTISSEDLTASINEYGRAGGASRNLEMTEQLLEDNPLARMFQGTTSRDRTSSALQFFQGSGLRLKSSARGGLDVDAMLSQGLGAQFGELDENLKGQLRTMVSDIFGSVAANDPQALEEANKLFKQRLIRMLQSADSASSPTQAGGGTLAESAAKINALIDASASIIQAMANTNVEQAKRQLEAAIRRVNSITASASEVGG